MRGDNARKRARSNESDERACKMRSQEWFRKNGFDDIGSAMKVNKGFLESQADIGVWSTTERLVTDDDLCVLKEELGVGLQARGARDLRWFGANWQGYGKLEPTASPMPPRSQAIVDKICLKTGFPKVTVSTLHCYYRAKGKRINEDFGGEFKGRKYAIVPHTDDKLLRGNGGVMMLQVTGNAEVVMSVRKGNSSRVTASVNRDLGHILVCEGEAFLAPHQHSVLWVDDDAPTMMTLTMRSIPLDWEQKEKKTFQKFSGPSGGDERLDDRISERLSNGGVLDRREGPRGDRYNADRDRYDRDRDRDRGSERRDRGNRGDRFDDRRDRRGDRREGRDGYDGRDRERGNGYGGKGRDRSGSRSPRVRSTTREPSPKTIDSVFTRDARSPSRVPEDISYDQLKDLYTAKKAAWNEFREYYKSELGCYPTVDDLEHWKLRARKALFEQCKALQEQKTKMKEEKKEKKKKKEKKEKKEKKAAE